MRCQLLCLRTFEYAYMYSYPDVIMQRDRGLYIQAESYDLLTTITIYYSELLPTADLGETELTSTHLCNYALLLAFFSTPKYAALGRD